MAVKPYYTSNDLIASVKRKILFPISQVTFTELDILAFANEEMMISQVPSVLQFHEEYFVTYKQVPLQTNNSRYAIPDRATGMKLRDLFWMDQNGNLFEMTRIEEHDKAFFQANIGANQALHKFYIEGNYIVLTPGVVDAPSGSLIFVFYLRPNQLVKDNRAAIITNFYQTVYLNNSLISPLDVVLIDSVPFTAVNTLGGTISAITAYSDAATKITSVGHQLTTGQTVVLTLTDSNPNVNGVYLVSVLDADNFLINIQISTPGTTGTFTSPNQFLIGVTGTATASNLASAINTTGNIINATSLGNVVTANFANIYANISAINTVGFVIPQTTIGVTFNNLSSTYTDQETNITEPLYVNNTYIDIMKTKPGHQTYVYDVQILNNRISGNSILFDKSQLLVPTGTVNNAGSPNANNGGSTIQFIIAPLVIGDYIALANESIIPQIPPDLHNGLAERTAARILAAIGDQQGLQTSLAKIAEIDQKQGNLLDNRSEGTPQKVVARHSLLRYGKMGSRRRL